MNSFIYRIVRAARLDPYLYEEVEADTGAFAQAMAVVVLSSIAAGIGSLGFRAGHPVALIVMGAISALVGWFIWAYLIYFIGTKLLPEPETKSNVGELLRTVGFASSPGLIRVFGIFPVLRSVVFIAAAIWMVAAMIVAVKHALDYTSTWRAVGVCIIGWVIESAIIAILFSLSHHPGT